MLQTPGGGLYRYAWFGVRRHQNRRFAASPSLFDLLGDAVRRTLTKRHPAPKRLCAIESRKASAVDNYIVLLRRRNLRYVCAPADTESR